MQTYDTVLKQLLTSSGTLINQLTHLTVKQWLKGEFPSLGTLHVDLLGETAENGLIHIEFQSKNDPDMAWRMAEYALAVRKHFGRFPFQLVIYVGNARLKMPTKIDEPRFPFSYELLDLRSLNGEDLLASPNLEANILSILTKLPDQQVAIRQILSRIAGVPEHDQRAALQHLALLATLRNLGHTLEIETARMPVTESILNNDWLGPIYKRGFKKGKDKGLQKGRLSIVQHLMEKRFGPLPAWANTRLSELTTPELEDLSLRLLDAQTLDELFAR